MLVILTQYYKVGVLHLLLRMRCHWVLAILRKAKVSLLLVRVIHGPNL